MTDNKDNMQIHNVGSYSFAQSGKSTVSDNMGMREMQSRAYGKRNCQYILIQAPPACGKSRALMYLALDKVIKQGLKKVFIAVPQIAIGSSFKNTNLTSAGFFADWEIDSKYNLCLPTTDEQKVARALEFLSDDNAHYLLCSHATLTYFFNRVENKKLFDNTLIAIDEFHHVSEHEDNRLGDVIHTLMHETNAHIIAMTGSYFRGDSVPVLSEEDDRLFDRVIYTYYEQLNGYKYLKSLGIDYAFYSGRWLDAIDPLIDTDKKMIIHIPNVNSRESSGFKNKDVAELLGKIGKVISRDDETGIYLVQDKKGRMLRVADLVTDTDNMQGVTLASLRHGDNLKNLNIIIALNMAKEGFDWPECEYALTVGFRSSLTELVQIIGRATRDCEGKKHAQFTNLLAMPSALVDDVQDGVNSLLKAITLSLLMEQVLAPNVHFRKRGDKKDDDVTNNDDIVIKIDDTTVSQEVLDLVNEKGPEIINNLLNDSDTIKTALFSGSDNINESLINDIIFDVIARMHPELDNNDIAVMSKAIATALIIKVLKNREGEDEGNTPDTLGRNTSGGQDGTDTDTEGKGGITGKPFVITDEDNTQFLNINGKFINVNELDFSLIESINPFEKAYQFVSKVIDPDLLLRLQEMTAQMREKMTKGKALQLWPYIQEFVREKKREPLITSTNDYERRLAIALAIIREEKRAKNARDKVESV